MSPEEWERIKDRARATRARRSRWSRRWRVVLRLVRWVVLPGCAVMLAISFPDVALFVVLAPIFAAGVALLVGTPATVKVLQLGFDAWLVAGAPSVGPRRRSSVATTVEPRSDRYLGKGRRRHGAAQLDDFLGRKPRGNQQRRYRPSFRGERLREIGADDGWQWLWSGFPAPRPGGDRVKYVFLTPLVLWAADLLAGAALMAFLLLT